MRITIPLSPDPDSHWVICIVSCRNFLCRFTHCRDPEPEFRIQTQKLGFSSLHRGDQNPGEIIYITSSQKLFIWELVCSLLLKNVTIKCWWQYWTYNLEKLYWSLVISLLFNTPYRFVIAVLPRSKCLLISGIFKSRDIILPTKVHLVKAMVFSRSHVWMWELDYKQSWEPKNWYFWTVVLEKTLESPLDGKEIQPVHPKGDQSWIFIGRTDTESPILWPPDVKNWFIGKDPDTGKDWGQ